MTANQWATIIARSLYLGLLLFCVYKLGGWYWTGAIVSACGLIPQKFFKEP